MSALENYRAILEPHLKGTHFFFGEICKPPSSRHAVPPLQLQRNILPTIEAAIELRQRMLYRCDREGWPFHGLRVNAAFRPNGGAPGSQHKKNRALDLDLMFRDWDPATVAHSVQIRRAWYEISTALWYEGGRHGGLGHYCPHGKDYGVRVHWDCRSGSSTWQIVGASTAVHPPCSKTIAWRLGL